jgi:hypothetical protein
VTIAPCEVETDAEVLTLTRAVSTLLIASRCCRRTIAHEGLKATLESEINEEAGATLNSDTSCPSPKPANGTIAVKVINHLGDEVMKVFAYDGAQFDPDE